MMSRIERPAADSSNKPGDAIALGERDARRMDAALAMTGDEQLARRDLFARAQIRERAAGLRRVDVERQLVDRRSCCHRRGLVEPEHDHAALRERFGEQLAAAVLAGQQRAVPIAIGRPAARHQHDAGHGPPLSAERACREPGSRPPRT